MHLNVMGGFGLGSSKDEVSYSDADYTTELKQTFGSGNYGVNFQYGLAESFSAGIGLELGTSVLVQDGFATDSDGEVSDTTYGDLSMSTFKVILGGRYYIVNKDKFNFFVGPNVGFTSAKEKTSYIVESYESPKTKFSGLNLGLDAGVNFYFTDMIGGIVKLGYEANMTKGDVSIDDYTQTTKRNFGGVKIMAGLAFKF